jgi:hypothetical protein
MNQTAVAALIAAGTETAVAQPAVIISVARQVDVLCLCRSFSFRSDTVGAWNWDSYGEGYRRRKQLAAPACVAARVAMVPLAASIVVELPTREILRVTADMNATTACRA